jgi:teichuronic acid biosynthesis glycosyltransferase TuaC
MRVAVVAEFYPRAYDPVLGVWAHRQAVAAAQAGAEVTVFVLHRLVPPASGFNWRQLRSRLAQPRRTTLDGIEVHYVRYVSPPRSRSYAYWGAWAALPLGRAIRRAAQAAGRDFDLIHAHNAVPAADAALRARLRAPLVVSVHGGDVLWTVDRVPSGGAAVARAFERASLVMANSAGIAERARALGAAETEVVHLGTDIPAETPPRATAPTLVTVGHLVARKRHVDVLRALPRLPADIRYLIIGDGPERPALERLAAELGVSARVEFAGQLDPAAALHRARAGWLFVMPSTEEAFGVAYIEAMAAGIPAIGAATEPGPKEIAAAGAGMELVPPRDPEALAERISALLSDEDRLAALSAAARATVESHFTWERCGEQTLAAYEAAASHRHA